MVASVESSHDLRISSLSRSDIEGSTRLWEASLERMALALGLHDRACRDVVHEQGGRIVKMTGDGMCAAFADPGAAVRTAVCMQGRRRSATGVGEVENYRAYHRANCDKE